jgi:uncharacterized membrane protein
MEEVTRAEAFVHALSPWLVHIIEACSVLVIFYGVVRAFASWVWGLVRGAEKVPPARVRLDLGLSLALALEFLLAADILETIVSPTLQQVGILGGIAIIRTGLNYFLSKEIKEENEELRDERRLDSPPREGGITPTGAPASGD